MTDDMKYDLVETARVPAGSAVGSGRRGSQLDDLVARFEASELAAARDRQLTTASLRAGRLIRAMRTDAGLSQAQLAQKLDVSQARISELEVGLGKQGPTLEVFERIAAACGLQLALSPHARREPRKVMAYTVWEGAKDTLGALGSVLIAIPWFRDFDWRRRRDKFNKAPFGGAAGASFKARMLNVYRRKIESPRASDLVFSLLGLLAIFLSYVIALWLGITGNAAGTAH